jgi:heterodisulfide reductase subunit C
MRIRLNKAKVTSDFLKRVEEISGENAWECYQCGNCSAGCPMSFAMELLPNQVIRLVHLGREEDVYNANTIWLCASCLTCASRCPRGVNLAKINEAIRHLALKTFKDKPRYGPEQVSEEDRKEAPPMGISSAYRKFGNQ